MLIYSKYMAKNLPKFKQAKILVVGDIILDHYWNGTSSRISPEAPIPVVLFQDEEYRLGGAANVALNCHALGADVKLLGAVGQDEHGRHIVDILEKEKIRSALTSVTYLPTTTKLRVLAQHQQLLRIDFEDVKPLEETEKEHLFAEYEESLSRVDVVILSDYHKGVLDDPQRFIQCARKAKKLVMIDPKSKDFEIYRGATVLTPNQNEFEAVYGKSETQQDLYEKAKAVCRDLDIEVMLITQGAKGVSLIQRNKMPYHIGARTQEVVDITGAGDTLLAAFGSAVAAGEDLVRACMAANIAAGISVRKLGTASVSFDELYYEQQGFAGVSQIIMSEKELDSRIKTLRREDKKIVMTNGCFDMLHPGHIHYLQQAKALGDCLIVAVNDDKSIRKLKGPDRPKNSLDIRCNMLANLRCVDYVVPFGDDTPLKLIELIKPELLVKGGDYKINKVVGKDFVESYGGKVQILDYVKGISTTNLLEMMKKHNGK